MIVDLLGEDRFNCLFDSYLRVLLELTKLVAINKAMAIKAIPRTAKMSLRFMLHVFKQREGHANAAKLAKTVPNPVYSESNDR